MEQFGRSPSPTIPLKSPNLHFSPNQTLFLIPPSTSNDCARGISILNSPLHHHPQPTSAFDDRLPTYVGSHTCVLSEAPSTGTPDPAETQISLKPP